MGLASPARRIFVDEQQQATHRGSGSPTKKPSVPLGSPHQGTAARHGRAYQSRMVSDHSRLPPPAGVALSLPIHPASLLRPGCRYQSRGACGQTVSPVRSGMTPTAARQRGVGSVPRRPGSGESHHHSAELRSMRDQPPASVRATDRHIALPPLLQAADPSNSLTHLR